MKYNKSYILEQLYSRDLSPLEFNWENLYVPGLVNYLSYYDIEKLHNIATSVKYANKIKMKKEAINSILVPRGFKFFHAGTNRIVYQYLEDSRFLIKVALDRVGMKDNPTEYKVQHLLKPFVTKVFDISPDGSVGSFERITPILNREEFALIADDVFNLLTKCILGKYIMNDIGTNSWMNYGIRPGFGVCLLDFPYCYELDGSKLYCTVPVIPNTKFPLCGGEIDYDVGFNNLVCTKCGATFNPKDLEKKHGKGLLIIKGGTETMGVIIKRGNDVIRKFEAENEAKFIDKQRRRKTTTVVNDVDNMGVNVSVPKKDTSMISNMPISYGFSNPPTLVNSTDEEPKVQDSRLDDIEPEVLDFITKHKYEMQAIIEIPIADMMKFIEDYASKMEDEEDPVVVIESEEEPTVSTSSQVLVVGEPVNNYVDEKKKESSSYKNKNLDDDDDDEHFKRRQKQSFEARERRNQRKNQKYVVKY